jgi:ATP-binding cassette subfamily B protein
VLTFGQVIADLLLPNYMADIIDRGIAAGDTHLIVRKGGVMLAVSLAGVICAMVAGFLAARTSQSIARDLRTAVFSRITHLAVGAFDKIGAASLITRTTNDIQQIQGATFSMLRMMLRAPVTCIGGIFMAVNKNAQLSVILLIILPFIAAGIYMVTQKAVPMFRRIQQKLDNLNLIIRENLTGIRIIRAFSRLGFERKKFNAANTELTAATVRMNRIMAVMNPTMMLCMNLLTIAIVWVASFRIDRGRLTVGDMMAFIQYAIQIFMALTAMSMMFIALPRAFTSAERLREVFALKSDVKEAAAPQHIASPTGALRFDHVWFRYENAEQYAVKDVTFTAMPGNTVAIIGGTGSGKTSLINLICRYYDVERGAISIDEVDIRQLRQSELHHIVGLTPQKSMLFSGTVRHNIAMGNPDAPFPAIVEACRIAQAEEFINAMPLHYDTPVSQGGANLSGGQKQRLTIARTIVKKPKIYVFDDCFSALDFKTDAAIRAALREETRHATVIIVAQRIASIRNADRILVMDNGSIVGEGTHTDLLKNNSVYQEIYASQNELDRV